jgi:tRNA A37 threonylcarbamoyladenosine dehydratase
MRERVWKPLKLLATLTIIVAGFLSSLTLVQTVSGNSSAVDNARDAVLASCQNLNRKIEASTNEAAQRSTDFLVREIVEHMTPAEQAEYERLVKKAAQTPLTKTRCDHIVDRTFPE